MIIIGSMKSGTTSFYKYLIQHPNICPSKEKELNFFTKNKDPELKICDYLKLWDFDESKHKVAIEASTGYTKFPFNANIPKKIFDSGLKPKFIYCVRNPFDRIISQYRFVNSTPNWQNIDLIGKNTISLGSYYLQLQQYRQFFKKEDILIIDFDDITSDAQYAVNKVFDFVNLPNYKIDSTITYNKTRTKQEKFIKNRFPRIIKLTPSKIKKYGKSVLNSLTGTKKIGLSEKERQIIFNLLAKDMKAFQEEYNFDVSKWGF